MASYQVMWDWKMGSVMGRDKRFSMTEVVNVFVDPKSPGQLQVMYLEDGEAEAGVVDKLAALAGLAGSVFGGASEGEADGAEQEREQLHVFEVLTPQEWQADPEKGSAAWTVVRQMCETFQQVHRRYITDRGSVAEITGDMVRRTCAAASPLLPRTTPAAAAHHAQSGPRTMRVLACARVCSLAQSDLRRAYSCCHASTPHCPPPPPPPPSWRAALRTPPVCWSRPGSRSRPPPAGRVQEPG
jgi:hypothetical protein